MGNFNGQDISKKIKYGGFSTDEINIYKDFYKNNLSNPDGSLNKKKLMRHLKLECTQDADKVLYLNKDF